MEKHAVYIGRFAPFHYGHMFVLKQALKKYDFIHVLVGSSNKAPNPSTPWPVATRIQLLRKAMGQGAFMSIAALPDFDNDDSQWIDAVRRRTCQQVHGSGNTNAEWYVIGSPKDTATMHYLDLLRSVLGYKLDMQPTNVTRRFLSGTEIRELHYRGMLGGTPCHGADIMLATFVPPSTFDFLKYDKQTIGYTRIVDWIHSIESSGVESRYTRPLIYVTTDAVVTSMDRVLLIQRGGKQGHGQWALPGGFLEANLSLKENIRKELREETGIIVKEPHHEFVVDTVGRSCRGRTITHVFCFKISSHQSVTAGDDAQTAHWVSVGETPAEECWFEDHYAIYQRTRRNLK